MLENGIRPLWISVPTAIALTLLFTLGVLLTVLVWLPLLVIFGRFTRVTMILQAMDRLCGAALFWNGRHTISWECGGDAGLFCRTICAVLDKVLQKRHCEMQREGNV